MSGQIGIVAYRTEDHSFNQPRPVTRKGAEIDTNDLARGLLALFLKDMENERREAVCPEGR